MPALREAALCPACKTPYIDEELNCRVCSNRRKTSLPGVFANTLSVQGRFAIVLLNLCAIIAACIYFNVRMVMQSDAYQEALRDATSSPSVQKVLGDGIHAKYPVGHWLPFLGLESVDRPAIPRIMSEFAEWSVALQGSRGRGHLYGVANHINGIWEFSRLTFQSEGRATKVDLTPIRRINFPPMPTQKVYLVPVGLDSYQSLDWAPAYYKEKLGIEVSVLPSISLDRTLIDSQRGQLNAGKCIEFIKDRYPELARDASVMMIGVTSSDMYMSSNNWRYTENMRSEGRFAVISSARVHPPALWEKLNPEWLTSRVQKLITKNLVMLYFGLPLSSDYTSLMSGGVLPGWEIDQMGGQIIGAEGKWDPFFNYGGAAVTVYDVRGKTPIWRWDYAESALPDINTQIFSSSLTVGLIIQRKMDFVFPDEPSLQFSRVYRNQDDRSRAFGIGGSNTFDMFLGGQMGVGVDLIMADGHRVQFVHDPGPHGDSYRVVAGGYGRFTEAIYMGAFWQVKTTDDWTYYFPYKPSALPQYVTVLTGFVDPVGHKYEMERDSFGSLLSVSSPSGKWLHFENDAEHRISKITSSLGRSVRYNYDDGGHLIRATDSDGLVDAYTYDDKGQMLTAAHEDKDPILINEYFVDGYIKSQTFGDHQKFIYHYFRNSSGISENQITDPNGLETYVRYAPGGFGFEQWLPTQPPH
jgi:YD repeat-containing protein